MSGKKAAPVAAGGSIHVTLPREERLATLDKLATAIVALAEALQVPTSVTIAGK